MKIGLTLSLVFGIFQFHTYVEMEAGRILAKYPCRVAIETVASTNTSLGVEFGANRAYGNFSK